MADPAEGDYLGSSGAILFEFSLTHFSFALALFFFI